VEKAEMGVVVEAAQVAMEEDLEVQEAQVEMAEEGEVEGVEEAEEEVTVVMGAMVVGRKSPTLKLHRNLPSPKVKPIKPFLFDSSRSKMESRIFVMVQ
jgi:hypothetical protein